MVAAKRKLRRAGEPVRAIVGGGSKSMAKMENKARLGSGGFFGDIQVLETGHERKICFFFMFSPSPTSSFFYEHDLLKYLKNWVTMWAPRC